MSDEHDPMLCECLDCMGGMPWPGAGTTVPAEEFVALKASTGKCASGHPLVLSNRIKRRGKLTYECRECRRLYNANYYQLVRRERLGVKAREFKSGSRML